MKVLLTLTMVVAIAGTSLAEIRTETVHYKAGDTDLVGYLAWDDSVEGPAPGVLVIHEWWGLNDYAKKRTREVAALGYVAFALDMYGEGQNTEDPQQSGRWASDIRRDAAKAKERLAAGLDVLRNHELVDKNRVAAMGYCFGGGMVLNMARANMPVRGVVSFHGGLSNNFGWRPETIQPEVLVLHGGADPTIDDEEIADFLKEMRETDANYQFNIYSDARHAFTNPAADDRDSEAVGYNQQADERSWEAMKMFFAEVLE